MNHKCKMCGGVLTPAGKEKIITCEYCGTKQTLPCPDSERIAGLYEKADSYRRNLEFDKALVLYEEILNEDSTDAECYWLALLCEFGIEYVEETAGAKRIPTINRMQPVSVFDNANYKAALQYADVEQAVIYKAEAEEISGIQKGILEISEKEDPFDIFICYKETDEQGRRTLDSVLATDLYELLTKEDYKVFFSRVTLDDKIGVAYEPYIYAALQSSKIMIAVGAKEEHYNAVWVRNEWSRYLAMIKSGAKKVLIPAYKDMEPYELPEEFAHLQAINLGELGCHQDLVRGIRKILAPNYLRADTMDMEPGLREMIITLGDKKWEEAERLAEQFENENPGDIKGEVVKLMAAMHISDEDDCRSWGITPPDKSISEILAKGKKDSVNELKSLLSAKLPESPESRYQHCKEKLENAKFSNDLTPCLDILRSLKGYRDSEELYLEAEQKVDRLINKEREEYKTIMLYADTTSVEYLEQALKYMRESGSPLVMREDIEKAEKNLKIAKSQQSIENAEKTGKKIMSIVVVVWILIGIIFFFGYCLLKGLLLMI